MSKDVWTEVTMTSSPLRWRFDEQNSLEGVVNDITYPITEYGEGMRVVLSGKDGELWQFFAPTHLRRLLEHGNVQIGEYVRIVYKGRGQKGHLFTLSIRRQS